MATIKLRCLEQVKREMKRLEPRLQKNILRGAVAKVASEIRNDAKVNVPVEEGTLKRNIKSRRRRGRKNVVRASVIISDPKWRFVEFGHFDRGGNFIPGVNFITRAYENMRRRIDQVMSTYMRTRIEKALTKR